MVNSTKIAMEFHQKFPAEEAPEHTEGYEGFYHFFLSMEMSKKRNLAISFVIMTGNNSRQEKKQLEHCSRLS